VGSVAEAWEPEHELGVEEDRAMLEMELLSEGSQ
jgi:hypothetical protein